MSRNLYSFFILTRQPINSETISAYTVRTDLMLKAFKTIFISWPSPLKVQRFWVLEHMERIHYRFHSSEELHSFSWVPYRFARNCLVYANRFYFLSILVELPMCGSLEGGPRSTHLRSCHECSSGLPGQRFFTFFCRFQWLFKSPDLLKNFLKQRIVLSHPTPPPLFPIWPCPVRCIDFEM